MDIEDFYDQDPRRRASDEIEFGREWTEDDLRFEVAWIADTGEVYVMAEPYSRRVCRGAPYRTTASDDRSFVRRAGDGATSALLIGNKSRVLAMSSRLAARPNLVPPW